MTDARKYGTTNPVLIEARVNHDPFDEFVWCEDWRFAIAQFLTDVGEYVPYFQGSASNRFDFAYEMISGVYPDAPDHVYESEAAELRYALKILDRYRNWLRLAGRDY